LETIKLILGEGETLIGRLVLFDALKFKFREFALKKNPECPVCGTAPTIHQLIDYEQFCGIEPPLKTKLNFNRPEMSVDELKNRLDKGDDVYILDVREPNEYEIANLGGHLIPLSELPGRVGELDPYKEIVVHCKSGIRSAKAVQFLQKAGFTKTRNLAGGIDAWAKKFDSEMARY
jgi:adenylyltransferase/sulfurtransferase